MASRMMQLGAQVTRLRRLAREHREFAWSEAAGAVATKPNRFVRPMVEYRLLQANAANTMSHTLEAAALSVECLVTLARWHLDGGAPPCDREGGECSICSILLCPHLEPLHLHHDGCPSCTTEGEE